MFDWCCVMRKRRKMILLSPAIVIKDAFYNRVAICAIEIAVTEKRKNESRKWLHFEPYCYHLHWFLLSDHFNPLYGTRSVQLYAYMSLKWPDLANDRLFKNDLLDGWDPSSVFVLYGWDKTQFLNGLDRKFTENSVRMRLPPVLTICRRVYRHSEILHGL